MRCDAFIFLHVAGKSGRGDAFGVVTISIKTHVGVSNFECSRYLTLRTTRGFLLPSSRTIRMKFAAAATAARASLVKGAALGKKLMSSAGAAVTTPPPPFSSRLSRGMMASAAMPRPKVDPPQEQHGQGAPRLHPMPEEDEENATGADGPFRRELTDTDIRIDGVEAAAAAAASDKTFPMWLGKTKQS